MAQSAQRPQPAPRRPQSAGRPAQTTAHPQPQTARPQAPRPTRAPTSAAPIYQQPAAPAQPETYEDLEDDGPNLLLIFGLVGGGLMLLLVVGIVVVMVIANRAVTNIRDQVAENQPDPTIITRPVEPALAEPTQPPLDPERDHLLTMLLKFSPGDSVPYVHYSYLPLLWPASDFHGLSLTTEQQEQLETAAGRFQQQRAAIFQEALTASGWKTETDRAPPLTKVELKRLARIDDTQGRAIRELLTDQQRVQLLSILTRLRMPSGENRGAKGFAYNQDYLNNQWQAMTSRDRGYPSSISRLAASQR